MNHYLINLEKDAVVARWAVCVVRVVGAALASHALCPDDRRLAAARSGKKSRFDAAAHTKALLKKKRKRKSRSV